MSFNPQVDNLKTLLIVAGIMFLLLLIVYLGVRH
jgi:hypothetical protein